MQIIFSYKIIFIIILLLLFHQLKLYLVLWIFMILHELGHIISVKILKCKIQKLYITPFGFSLKLEKEPELLSNKLWIESSGIIANLCFMAIGVCIHSNLIIMSNLAIIILNLIPIYPLDGGRILKNALEYKLEKLEAEKIMNKISNVVLILITVLTSFLILKLHNFILIFAIYYLWVIMIKENKKLKLKKRVYNIIKNY